MKTRIAKLGLSVIASLMLCSLDTVRAAFDNENSARFNDWDDVGCKTTPGGAGSLGSSAAGAGGNGAHCASCGGSVGMPAWWVNEPYVNLWLVDEPLSYMASGGPTMSFRWTYRQRTHPSDYLHYRELDGAGLNGRMYVPIWLREKEEVGGFFTMTNAAWCHNWWSEIVFWDTNYEAQAHSQPTFDGTRVFWPFTSTYTALIYTGDGGIIPFNGSSASGPNGTASVRVEIMGQVSAGGGPEVPTGWDQYPSPYTNVGTIWVENPQYGFRVTYPDGSRDEYGFVALVGLGGPVMGLPIEHDYTARAYLTRRLDASGRAVRIGYYNVPTRDTGIPYYVVRYVVDANGRTNTYSYNATWDRLLQVEDPYGRTASLGYDIGTHMLNSITDAVQMASSFQYRSQWGGRYDGWVTSFTTPYGTTSFTYDEAPDTNVVSGYSRRALLISEPGGAHQMFCYRHNGEGLVSATTTNAPQVSGITFDTGSGATNSPQLYYRNSFYWDRRQFAALSSGLQSGVQTPGNLGNALTNLSEADSRKGRLRHWLLGKDGISVTESLSSERDPSPDSEGQIEGARTWYDYPGKDSNNPHVEGDSGLVRCVARALPEGGSTYVCLDYGGGYFPLRRWESYTMPYGGVGTRTNWYSYAANGIDLRSISNSIGQRWSIGYNGVHQPTSLTNGLNEVTGLAWDSYTLTTNLAQVSLPSGQTLNLSYYAPANPPGWPLGRTNSLLKTITVQPQNLTIEISDYTNGLPRVVTTSGTGLPALTVTNYWDGLNRLTGRTYPDGTTISNIYDRLYLGDSKDRRGNWTHYTYDSLEHLTRITDARGLVAAYGWCDCGALDSVTDGAGKTTTLDYNNQTLLTNILFPDLSTLSYARDSLGRVEQVADGLGRTLRYGYNNQGQVTTISNTYGLIQQVTFDAADRPIEVTDANGVTFTNQFDGLNRLTNRIWQDAVAEGFGYSTNGLVCYTNRNDKITRFSRDGAGRIVGVTNANQEVIRLAYNCLNAVTDLWDGRTNHTTWSYDAYGRLYNKVDAVSHEVLRLTRDPNGQITNRWTPQFGDTAYSRDARGNILDINYGQTSLGFTYDGVNRINSMTDGLGTTIFSYTKTGQPAMEIGPWPEVMVWRGYTQGLRTSLGTLDPDSYAPIWQQTNAYDAAWRLESVASPAGTFSYVYNEGAGIAASALVRRITLPNSAWITNHYDSLSRLDYTALANRWGHVLDGYGYTHDLIGQRTNIFRENGLTNSSVSVGYDNIGQLTSWHAREGVTNALRLNEQMDWGYDSAGNLRYRTNGGLVQTFGCNSLNQLTNITRNGTLTVSGATRAPAASVTVNGQAAERYGDFTFAATDLNLQNGANTFTVIAENAHGVRATNTITSYLPATNSFSWDANGNLTNDGTRSFAYSPENRLTNITVTGQWKADFVHDGLGRRRIEREYAWSSALGDWQSTNELHFVYDGWLLMQVCNSNNVPLVTYTRGLDLSGSLAGAGGIGGLLARTDGSGSTFYHCDGAGNITGLMDGQQNMAARYMYGAFGNLIRKSGGLADANRMMFSSRRGLGASDIYDFGGGDYLSSLQRWGSPDPGAELNRYQFNYNNPLSYIDPDGMAPQLVSVTADSSGRQTGAGYVDYHQGEEYGIGRYSPPSPLRQQYSEWGEHNRQALQESHPELAKLLDAVEEYGPYAMGSMGELGELGQLGRFGKSMARCKDAAKGGTTLYSAVENGATKYVGMTDDLAARAAAHLRQKGIIVNEIPGLSGLARADARAVEQVLIETHGLGKNGGTLLNKINSIAKDNPAYAESLKRGAELLKQAGYPGF